MTPRTQLLIVNSFLFFALTTTASAPPAYFVMPFKLRDKLIIVPATVDGQSGDFVVDTGIGGLILNERYFEGTHAMPPMIGIVGGQVKVKVKNVDFQMGEIALEKIAAEIINLDALERDKNMRIHGLIGNAAFAQYEVILDYSAQELRIYQLDNRGNCLVSEDVFLPPFQTLNLYFKAHLPCFKANIGEEKLLLGVDTGAEANLMDIQLWKKLGNSLSNQGARMLVSIGNGNKEKSFAQVNNLSIGSLVCAPMNSIFSTLKDLNVSLGGAFIDGLIGFELLSQFCIGINYRKKEIYFWEKSHPDNERVVMTKN